MKWEKRELKAPAPPHLAGKVIGYRAWTLDGYRLKSGNAVQHGGYWEIGPNRAVCRIQQRARYLGARGDSLPGLTLPAHDAPHRECECGLYAWFKVNRKSGKLNAGGGLTVYGAVTAWGRMEVHADGFRAEYAEPVALAYSPRDPYEDLVKAETMAGELGLPLVTLDDLPAEAGKHGQDVPDELRLPSERSFPAVDPGVPVVEPWAVVSTEHELRTNVEHVWRWGTYEPGLIEAVPKHTVAFSTVADHEAHRVLHALWQELQRRHWSMTVCTDPGPYGRWIIQVHLEGPSDEHALYAIRAALRALGFTGAEEALRTSERTIAEHKAMAERYRKLAEVNAAPSPFKFA